MPTILITGGLGFIGSHSAIRLYKQGFTVVIVDNLSRPSPNIFQHEFQSYNKSFLEEAFPEIKIIIGDIRNASLVEFLFNGEQPDGILHAAGQTSAIDSITDPENDFTNNTVGLFNVLEESRKSDTIKCFCYLSTNKVYGGSVNNIPLRENETTYVPENHTFLGVDESWSIDQSKHTPYGISKLTGDLYVQEYARLYGMNCVVFRMSCIYGPRQFGFVEQGWISHFLINAVSRKSITIFGNGKQVRDLLYIDDLSNLILTYFLKAFSGTLEIGQGENVVFNVGGGKSNRCSLKEVLKQISEIMGKDAAVHHELSREGDQKYYVSDIGKIQKLTGWNPKISPKVGILLTYKWIKNHKGFFYSDIMEDRSE